MRFLILGSSGMAGHIVSAYLGQQGHTVTGFARTSSPIRRTILGDASDSQKLRQVLHTEPFDCVINCIGVLNRAVDADISQGIYLNSLLPHLIADCISPSQMLVHISTDCVFSGAKGQYTESDIPDEVSLYGRTKALGEVVDERNLTIRTSIVGPELKQNGVGLFHWFMSQTGEIKGYTKAIWSGVTTLELAKAIERAAMEHWHGLYHLTNNQTICKYDLLHLFARYCRSSPISIVPEETFICDKSIQSTRECRYNVPSYETMVSELSDWIRTHPDLYRNYKEFLWKN